MHTSTFNFPARAELPMTGERYVPGFLGPVQAEHFHRYLFALKFVENRDLIDIASGEGYGTALLSQAARSSIGVDIDPEIVEHANRHYGSRSLSFRTGDAAKLPCESASADVVVSFETIEHLLNQNSFLAEVRRVLRPNGLLVISTPDKPLYDAILAQPNQFHLKELDRAEFQRLLQNYFRNVHVFEQRYIAGSVIVDALKKADLDGLEFFHSGDGTSFTRLEDKMDSPYLVALASDGDLPACAPSVMSSTGELDRIRGDLGYASAEMWRLQAEMPLLEQRYAELERQSKAQSEELRAQIEAQREQLRKAETFAELARAETQYLRRRLQERQP